ncbi:DNA-binding transcriptional regulator Fis [Ectothiorhodospiraceae bacterium BW-2]|nr:DNA-binding transcriptional regulator Fis [Ectothiorhodospiraceae bacterium BW-2]
MSECSASPDSTLNGDVKQALLRYFDSLEGQDPINLYNMFLGEVERPLLEFVMAHTRGNQSHAAAILGLNRATLRKKLKLYQLL